MQAFVLVHFGFSLLAVAAYFILLAGGRYPLREETTQAQAVLNVVVQLAVAAWSAYLLWG